MNDFTKEELIDIYESYDECFIHHSDVSEIEKSIVEKLQSLIDNYCDHKMCYGAGEYTYCDKCGANE